jgi:hypothetical protein
MKPAAFFALLCAYLAFAGSSEGAIGVGVADNTVLGSADGGAAYVGVLNDIGLRELRLPVKWDPGRPTEIENRRQIKALLPVAAVRGVNVAFSIQPEPRPPSPRRPRPRAGSSPSSSSSHEHFRP